MRKHVKHIIGTKEQIFYLHICVQLNHVGRVIEVIPNNNWSDKWTLVMMFRDRNERRRFYRRYGIRGSHVGGKGHTCAYFIEKAV